MTHTEIINKAINTCDGKISNSCFDQIYPFTTENINGYIGLFDLEAKSLLTVGSSGDQIINAVLNNCKDITLIDKNPYAKYYYYLKIACLLCLDKDEFLKFLRFKDYPKVFKDNKDIFDLKVFNKIKITLRLLDYESYLFWDELFQTYESHIIRDSLFSYDEDRTYVIETCNRYLTNSILYEEARKKIKNVEPKFIYGDLFDTKIKRDFDNIWLSNVAKYLSLEKIKKMVDNMSEILTENGLVLISYLYETTINTAYQDGWPSIYDLQSVFEMLLEYNPQLISFQGVYGLKFNNKISDSIILSRKHM